MLTFFSTPKPFAGHIDVIQRNALRSWQLVHPEAEILLFGDDAGAAEVSRELGIRHVPDVRRNRYGTKYLAGIYDHAQKLARHDLLCHVNCDIILTDDFARAIQRVAASPDPFLMAGRRWDVDIREPLHLENPNWRAEVKDLALRANNQRPSQWIDYFAFRRGLFLGKIPPFVIGRPGWDNWLLWFARHTTHKLIDASPVVAAIHQNHDYGYHPQGEQGVWQGEEAQENYALLEGHRKFRTLDNANYILEESGLRRNYRNFYVQARRDASDRFYSAWFALLNLTRPIRHRVGLRQKGGTSA